MSTSSKMIGESSAFAIEYQNSNSPNFGNSKIWVSSNYFGYFDEPSYFAYMQGAFEDFENVKPHLNIENNQDNPGRLYNHITQEVSSDIHDKSIMTLGDSYDDFIVYSFIYQNKAAFVWRLREDPFFEYSDYEDIIHLGLIDIEYMKNVLSEFNKIITD